MAEERPNHLHEEIKALETILREKRRELEAKGLAPSGVEGEKELLKEALKERVAEAQEKISLGQIPDQSLTPPITPTDKDDPLAGLDHREQIEELATIAFSKGIVEAVNVARRAGNAHLLDEFHDALVDRLYDYLVQEGVIERSK